MRVRPQRKPGDRTATRRPAILLLVILLAAGSLLAFHGCGGKEAGQEERVGEEISEREIPLRTLLQGSTCDYGSFEPPATGGETGPAFLVLGDEDGLKRFLSLSGLEIPAGEIDFSRQVVIAAMQGPKNTSGYAISVLRAVQAGTEVRVEVEVVEPEPGSVTAPMLTSPFHLVTAEKEDFQPRGELSFVFVDMKGEVLDKATVEI